MPALKGEMQRQRLNALRLGISFLLEGPSRYLPTKTRVVFGFLQDRMVRALLQPDIVSFNSPLASNSGNLRLGVLVPVASPVPVSRHAEGK